MYADVGRNDQIEDEKINAETILETLVDPIVNELFIRIIRIIEFFCKEFYKLEIERKNQNGDLKLPSDKKLLECFSEVCDKMND